jgi:hypothetical protein
MTASSGTSSTTRHPCDQRAGSDRGGEENAADPTVASLTSTSVLDYASIDLATRCGRRRERSLNGHANVLV